MDPRMISSSVSSLLAPTPPADARQQFPDLSARDPLNPNHWPEDESPSWEACAKAFPHLGPKTPVKKEDLEAAAPTSIKGDTHGRGASLFSREKGFWVSVSLMNVCDQTMASLKEIAFFYPTQFPWKLAAQLRATSVSEHAEFYSPIAEWVKVAAEQTARAMPGNTAAQKALALAQSQEPTPLWGHQGLPSSFAPETARENPLWGVLDIQFATWDLLPIGEANDPEAFDPYRTLTDEEEAPMVEMLGVFAKAFARAMEESPIWAAGASVGQHTHSEYRPRWGDNDFPSCLANDAVPRHAFEAAELFDAVAEQGQAEPASAAANKAKHRI